MRLKVSGPRNIQYDLYFSGKFCVIIGDSATGKTVLYKALMRRNTDRYWRYDMYDDNGFNITDRYTVYNFDDFKRRPPKATPNFYNNSLMVIDDTGEESLELFNYFANGVSNVYYLLISRHLKGVYTNKREQNRIATLPFNYSAFSYYKMLPVGKEHYLEPVVNKEAFEVIKGLIPNKIVTEDSTAGHTFFWYFLRKACVVQLKDENGNPTGKDSLSSLLRFEAGKTLLLIIDWCSFGNNINDLLQSMRKYNVKVYSFTDIKSFEYLMLHSNYVKMVTPELFVLKYESEEKAYEAMLEDKTRNTQYYLKHGSALPFCYVSPCCSYHDTNMYRSKGLDCNKMLLGNDKIAELFKGTAFEWLLDYRDIETSEPRNPINKPNNGLK